MRQQETIFTAGGH